LNNTNPLRKNRVKTEEAGKNDYEKGKKNN
jgi:hypothetical protein